MWRSVWLVIVLSGWSGQSLAASVDDVQIMLRQYLDADCNGVPETGNAFIPGSCLLYEITAVNNSAQVVNNVLISARIPEHTTLVRPYQYATGHAPLESQIRQKFNGFRLIETRLHALPAGADNRVVVNYLVRIL